MLALTSGCATLATQLTPAKHRRSELPKPITVHQIYSGTALNFIWATAVATGETGMDAAGRGYELCIFPFYFAVEIPLSLVADTVLLPLTIVKQLAFGDVTLPVPVPPPGPFDDLKEGMIFETREDVLLHHNTSEYDLRPASSAPFTLDQFRQDPSVGIIKEPLNKERFLDIIPAGTRLQVVHRYYSNVNALILDPQWTRHGEVHITRLLMDDHSKRTDRYLKIIDPHPSPTETPP